METSHQPTSRGLPQPIRGLLVNQASAHKESDTLDEIWAECDGKGTINYPAYGPRQYENHFLHSFKFKDGLIVEQREFMNPINQFRALGIKVPRIDRGAIPKD